MVLINQDLSDIKDDDMGGSGSWTAWPQGDYRMMVTASEYKPTKARTGNMLVLEAVCLEGSHQGAKKTCYLVLQHPKPDTMRIARVRLKELAIAVGHPTPDHVDESNDLHNKPFLAYVTKKKATDPKYGDTQGFANDFAGFKACNGGEVAQAPPPSGSGGGAPPDDIPFARFEWI